MQTWPQSGAQSSVSPHSPRRQAYRRHEGFNRREEAHHERTSCRSVRSARTGHHLRCVPGLVHRAPGWSQGGRTKVRDHERHGWGGRAREPVSFCGERELRVGRLVRRRLGRWWRGRVYVRYVERRPRRTHQQPPDIPLLLHSTVRRILNCQVFGGNGLIPNQDFGGGAKSLQLNTNTSGNPNFFTFAGPPGLLSARWDANGFFQQRFSGTSEFSVPGFKQQSTGVSSSASANTTGSVIGVLIPPNTLGSLGSNTNVILAI